MKLRLEQAGVEVVGVTDHHFVRSIYFFDPNGFRMEFTVAVGTAEQYREYNESAHTRIAAWTLEKSERNKKGKLMTTMHLNATHDPARRSWVASANQADTGDGAVPIGFGECRGRIAPARNWPA